MVVREKRNDKPCNHAESVNFQRQDNPSYFSASYIHATKGGHDRVFIAALTLEATTR